MDMGDDPRTPDELSSQGPTWCSTLPGVSHFLRGGRSRPPDERLSQGLGRNETP